MKTFSIGCENQRFWFFIIFVIQKLPFSWIFKLRIPPLLFSAEFRKFSSVNMALLQN